jgi:hypothetical protein
LGIMLIMTVGVYFRLLPISGYGDGDIAHIILPSSPWAPSRWPLCEDHTIEHVGSPEYGLRPDSPGKGA